MRILNAIAVFIFVTICAGSASAQAKQFSPSILPVLRMLTSPQFVITLDARLGLTPESKSKIEKMIGDAEKAFAAKSEEQQKASSDFLSMLARPDASASDLIAASQAIDKLEAALIEDRIALLLAIRGVLTPEQNAEFSKIIDQLSSPWKPALSGKSQQQK